MKKALTLEEVKALRRQVILGSAFTRDYKNSLGVKPKSACTFFNSYCDFLEEVAMSDGFRLDGTNCGEFLDKYDTEENLQTWWESYQEAPLYASADQKDVYGQEIFDFSCIMETDEKLLVFATTETPCTNFGAVSWHMIAPDGAEVDRLDLGACLENTLHRMIDNNFSDEDIFRYTGMRKDNVQGEETEDADSDSRIDIDLGYYIPGQMLSCREAEPEQAAA